MDDVYIAGSHYTKKLSDVAIFIEQMVPCRNGGFRISQDFLKACKGLAHTVICLRQSLQ